MDYAGFLRSQWQTLLDQWLGKTETGGINVAYIALPDISWIDRLCRPYQPGGGGKWVPLESVAPSEALVRFDGRGGRELWVRPEEKAGGAGRYAAYWRAFAGTCGYEA